MGVMPNFDSFLPIGRGLVEQWRDMNRHKRNANRIEYLRVLTSAQPSSDMAKRLGRVLAALDAELLPRQ